MTTAVFLGAGRFNRLGVTAAAMRAADRPGLAANRAGFTTTNGPAVLAAVLTAVLAAVVATGRLAAFRRLGSLAGVHALGGGLLK